MAIPTASFWGTNYYGHPPLTDNMLRRAEEVLQVKLPKALISLLRIQNGGYTNGFAHPMPARTSWAADHVPLDELFGVVTDESVQTAQNILSTAYMTKEWDLPPKQVLLSGNGHWWITLDYRRGPAPSVAWMDVDCGEDVQISPSFSEFMNGLVPAAAFETGDGT
ncbi:SMI1/KNR4 family protein [Rubrivivax sp. JA1026]|uniref:SMI1/KNR4 family protein n=1 Tax=Rubrivivax sp. JA1026 TaxID=2710888 RepID=UPI0013E952D8|nr:SMI1/KNR4 family protein [Rubrivivax sp. JA1026]